MNPDLEWTYSHEFYDLMVVLITMFALVAIVSFYAAATATSDVAFVAMFILGVFSGVGTMYSLGYLCSQVILLQIRPINFFKAFKFTKIDDTPAEEGQSSLEKVEEVKP